MVLLSGPCSFPLDPLSSELHEPKFHRLCPSGCLVPWLQKKSKDSILKGRKTKTSGFVFLSHVGLSSAMTMFLYQRPPLLQGSLILQSELSPSLSDSSPLSLGLGMVTRLAVASPGVLHHPLLLFLNPTQTLQKAASRKHYKATLLLCPLRAPSGSC